MPTKNFKVICVKCGSDKVDLKFGIFGFLKKRIKHKLICHNCKFEEIV